MKHLSGLCAFLCVSLLLVGSVPVAAQDGEASAVDDVVVTARRAGAPIWEISRGDSTVILVGAINGSRDLVRRPEALEAATARSQRILYPAEGRASVSDVFRLIWRIRTVARLPEGRTTADYLDPALQARLETVMAGERNQDWRRQGLVVLGLDLIERTGFDRGGRDVADIVKRAARKDRIAGRPVGIVRGDELVDNLIAAPPQTYAPCIAAATAAAEAGPESAAGRIEAWRSLRVAEVLATPLDQALNQCWPSGDPEIAPLLRSQWREAVTTALDQPGVTLGVAPLRILAEPAGVLDLLEAQGLDVVGPDWRPDETEAQ